MIEETGIKYLIAFFLGYKLRLLEAFAKDTYTEIDGMRRGERENIHFLSKMTEDCKILDNILTLKWGKDSAWGDEKFWK